MDIMEALRRDSSTVTCLSRETSIDSTEYQPPQEEAAYIDRDIRVGRPRLDRHKRKHSHKMHRPARVKRSNVEIPEEYDDYMRARKQAEQRAKKQGPPEEAKITPARAKFRLFETARASVLDGARDSIVKQIQPLVRSMYGVTPNITVSPTPLDPSVQERFLRVHEHSDFDITFHGTNRVNYESIYAKGLCVPFTHGVKVEHGSAHGIGIYSSTSAAYSSSYSNVSALLVCAHCKDTGKSVGPMRVSFSSSHLTPIAVVSWGDDEAETYTNYHRWRKEMGGAHDDGNWSQNRDGDDDDDDVVELNLFYEGLREYLQQKQSHVRWARRVDRKIKDKGLSTMMRKAEYVSRCQE